MQQGLPLAPEGNARLSDAHLQRLRERFEADPSDPVAFEALEEAHFLRGDWNELVLLYERRLAAPDLDPIAHPHARARLALRLGQVLEERCLELDRAVERYEEVARLDPAFRPALAQLRGVYAKRGQWELALQVAELEAQLPMRPFEQAAFATELGHIWLERLGDAGYASSQFEQALAADPQHVPALLGAARASELRGDARGAAALLERAADHLRGPDRAPVLVALARLTAEDLADEAGALALYRKALVEDPRHEEALRALAERARADAQWALFDELMERRFSVAAGAARRLELAREAARVQIEHARDPRAARHWLSRALELYPDDAAVHLLAADLERLAGNRQALGRHLRRAIELAGEELPVEGLRESAALAREAGDFAAELDSLRRALGRAPGDEELLGELATALARLGRDEELVEILEQQSALAAEGSAAWVTALVRLGRALEEHLGDAQGALEAFARAAEANPSDPEVTEHLERSCRKLEAWDRLRAHLERAVAHAGDASERAVPLRCALAELVIERFEDMDEARRSFDAALSLDPACLRARRGLERIALCSGDEKALVEAFEREAEVTTERERLTFLAFELARIFEGRGERERALGWLRRLACVVPDDGRALEGCARLEEELGDRAALCKTLERLDLLLAGEAQASNRRRLAGLYEAAGDLERSIEAYRAALALEANDPDTLAALRDALARAGRREEEAEVLRHLVALGHGEARARHLHALALLLEEPLGDLDGATAAWEALADDPHAPAEAAERLEAALERTGRLEQLLERLRARRARLGETGDDLDAVELRMTELLLDALRRPEEAAPVLRCVLERHPGHPHALEGLERALRALGDDAELLVFLAQRAEAEPDAERRACIDLERAVLLGSRPGGDAEARRLLEALAGEPSAVTQEAEQRLEALLELEGDFEAVRERLAAQLANAEGEAVVDLHLRLAALARDRLIDPDAAIEHLEEAAARAPGRADVWQALARLHQEEEHPADWVRALEGELATQPERERALALHARAAALCREVLCDPERAGNHYEKILALDPSHGEAAEFLAEQLAREERHEELVRMLEARLAALPLEEAAAGTETALRLRIAALRAGPLADAQGAIAALEPTGEREETLLVVAEPLADLYTREGRTEALVALARRAAAACDSADERAGWWLRLGDALRGRNALAESAEAYRRALGDRPDDRSAVAALCDLYRRLGEAGPLARLLEAELARVGGPAEIAPRLELAALLAGELGRPAEALRHLRRVLELEPGHGVALERALELSERLGEHGDQLALLELAAARTASPSEQARIALSRSHLLTALERRDEALASLRQAAQLDPASREVRRALRAALEGAGDWPGVLSCLEREVAEVVSRSPDEAAARCEEAARLAAAHVAPDAALPWLERLRLLRPRDASVVIRIAASHREAGRPEPLLRALEDEIALGPTPERRLVLERERAELLERSLDAPGRAIQALEAARTCDPSCVPVLRQLERLYRVEGRHAERVEIVEALIECLDAPERLTLRRTAAELHERLGHLDAAAAQLFAGLQEPEATAVDGVELLRGLGTALLGLGRPELWARVAEEELRRLDPEAPVFRERRAELHRALARAYAEQLGRPETAKRHLRALLDTGLLDAEGDEREAFEEAEAALLALLRRSRAVVELERRLSLRLAGAGAGADADAWLELGRLRVEALHRPAAAAEAFRQALAHDPTCLEALRGLRAAAERLGRFDEVAETLEREVALCPRATARERGAWLRRLGEVAWHELDSTTCASRAFAAALEADPRDLVALRALEALFETMEDYRGALDLYESEVAVLGEAEPERRQAAWLRAGELARDRTAEPERALRAYEAAAALGPLDPSRTREWAELYARLGRGERFTEVFAAWCDEPASGASAADHLRLARALDALGRGEQARSRAQRAVALEPDLGEAWDALADLHERAGQLREAAQALERTAGCHVGPPAAERHARAAALIEADEPERAATLLARAVADDPARAAVEARFARVLARLGRHAEAKDAALRALSLVGDPKALTRDERLATALAGAAAARAANDLASAAALLDAALAVDPQHAEALAAAGDVRFALGDLLGARRALEARLDLDVPDPDAALHRTRLAEALDAAGEVEAALARYAEALALDGALDAAHAGLVQMLEREGRVGEAVSALRTWAALPEAGAKGAARLLRAAELEHGAGRSAAAESLLREATGSEGVPSRAWALLARLLLDQDRGSEALEQAERGLEALAGTVPDLSWADLARVRGLVLERRGERRAAADAFADAACFDPRDEEAALAGARLLRGLGEWRAAAELLRRFVAAAPADEPALAAQALHQLGRLLAGPLEDVEGAIAAYRRALHVDPDQDEAREALAELLVHRPEHWGEAAVRHRELLERDPVRLGSLRALLRIARGRGSEIGVATGLALLRALGSATPDERAEAPARPPLSTGQRVGLEDPAFESARRVAQEAAAEIAEALGVGAPGALEEPLDAKPLVRFRAAVTAAEGELAAPSLIPLPTAELGQAVALAAALALDAEAVYGDGALVNALAASLGRRARRRVRRALGAVSAEAIAAIDFSAWRAELRGLASAVALDRSDLDLRTALLAWLDVESPREPRPLPAEADIRDRVAASPEARAFLRRLLAAWVEALEGA
jgi:tetratricopeptide (TPR) repeat protein